MKGNIEAVYCEFKYSGVGTALLGIAGISTALIVLATRFEPALKIAVIASIAPMTLQAMRRMTRPRWLRIDGERRMQVMFEGGLEVIGAVRDGSFVAPWLTIIRWRPEGRWFDQSLLVVPGMLDSTEFRRLRVLLRWS